MTRVPVTGPPGLAAQLSVLQERGRLPSLVGGVLRGGRLAEAAGAPLAEDDLFGPDYLLRRPLLRAIEHPGPRPAVLLLDEIDRADAEFEAFTFEVLA